MDLSTDLSKAQQYLQLHSESVQHMQNCVFDVIQRGQDLCQVGRLKTLVWHSKAESCPDFLLSVYCCVAQFESWLVFLRLYQGYSFLLPLWEFLFFCIEKTSCVICAKLPEIEK